jgi:hypothetical protein
MLREAEVRNRPDVVAHTYNPSIQEAKAGGSRVPGQSGLHSETLSQKKKTKEEKKSEGDIVSEGRGTSDLIQVT